MKRALPITLILIGALLLSGCFFVPAFNRVERGVDIADKIGPANSKRPLRVGSATMAQVLALVGAPQYSSDDGRRIAYTWGVINGYWILPLCFTTETQHGTRGIQLIFDSNDILRKYEIRRLDGSLTLWPAAIADMRQMFPELHRVPYSFRRSSTRPTNEGIKR